MVRIIDWLASRPFEIDLYLQNAHLLSILEDVLGGERLLSDLRRRDYSRIPGALELVEIRLQPPPLLYFAAVLITAL